MKLRIALANTYLLTSTCSGLEPQKHNDNRFGKSDLSFTRKQLKLQRPNKTATKNLQCP